jgi:putative ABC transport system ATP-binding protein
VGDRFEYVDVRVDGDEGSIISGFSARIPAKGLTAMVGPSGVGKTTLLRLLNRLDDPDDGCVLLDGADVRSHDVLALRRRVQLVGQVPVTFPGTVAANLDVGEEDAASLLERVGLGRALAGREADRLSVGESQRLCLARALALVPQVLVLDEPTSALVSASRDGFESLVASLAAGGVTVIMVTHDPGPAARLADHVIEVPRCAT